MLSDPTDGRPTMTPSQALPNQASVQATQHRTVQPTQVGRHAARTALPLGATGLSLSVALHAGALLGGFHLLHEGSARAGSRAVSLRFEESQASAAALPTPQPAPPATFESERNEPPVPAREVTLEPERFESVLARMVPPEAPLHQAATEFTPPKAGGFSKVDLLQKVRMASPEAQPLTPPAETAPPAVAAAAAAALVLAPRAGHNPQPEYPAAARRNGIEGTTLLALRIDLSGSVTDVRVVASSGSALLDEAAIGAARRWRFENGPGTVELPFVFRSRLPRS